MPREGRLDDLHLVLIDIWFGIHSVFIRARLDGATESDLDRVSIADAERPPCEGSLQWGRVRPGMGGWKWLKNGELVLSTDIVQLRPIIVGGQSAFDVRLVDGRCIRAPIVDRQSGSIWSTRARLWLGVGGTGAAASRDAEPFRTGAGLSLMLGVPIGDFRLVAYAEVLSSALTDGLGAMIVGSIGGDYGRRLWERLGARVGLGYDVGVAIGHTFRQRIHGPRLRLSLDLLPPRLGWPGFAEPRPLPWKLALEPSLALWMSDGSVVPVFGISIRIEASIWLRRAGH